MASSSDGIPVLPPMPDFSAYNAPFSSAGDMKFHLQTLLDNKEKQLQQAGTLGQRVLAQQMELEERIRQLQELEAEKSDDEEIDVQARDRYRELAETLVSWDAENAQLSGAFGKSKRFTAPSPTIAFAELPREEPERAKQSTNTSAAQSRRAKNAAHRADDVEFAFEIGSGLLTEVRRLQSLLGERDKAIQDMKEEKDDLEKSVESLRSALRQQEQSSDKYKEENWNLEVTLQELRTQLSDSQSFVQRLESEQKRLTKLLATSRDAGDTHKNESERLTNVLEEMKAKHETDIAQARKHAAGLARDKSDLQQTVDTMKKEIARAGRRFPHFGSPATPNGAREGEFLLTPAESESKDGDLFTGGASTNRRKFDTSAIFGGPDGELGDDFADSPEVSPVRPPFLAANHPNNEIEALQQRLAHAQRQINTLKGTLQREKQLKVDYRNKLAASTGVSPTDEEEVEGAGNDDEPALDVKKGRPRTITPFKVGGRGRGRGRRGGITLIQRLGMAAHSPSSEYNDDVGPQYLDSSPPPVPTIPIRFSQPEEDEEGLFTDLRKDKQEHSDDDEPRERGISRSPSPLEPSSNRTSVDGMDPAFANVLRRVPSNGSSYAGSPLRQSILNNSTRRHTVGRRSRGGVSYREARPPSLVDAPDVLSAELLGMEGSPMRSQEILEEIDEKTYQGKDMATAEFGCQTEFEEPKSAPPVIHVLPATADMSVQVDSQPEPITILPPPASSLVPVATFNQSMQTDDEPIVVIQKVDMGTQHAHEEALPPVATHVEMSVSTDPEPQPEPIPAPMLVPAGTQTSLEKVDADSQTVSLEKADVDTQTVPPEKADVDTQITPARPELRSLGVGMDVSSINNRRTTITQYDRSFGSSHGDTTIKQATGRTFLAGNEQDENDGNATETGVDTETDTDDYHDARQSIMMSTPSGAESRDDFHSVMTMTDNDFSESEDDGESIKASMMTSSIHGNASVSSSVGDLPRRSSSYFAATTPPVLEYAEVAVSADFKPEPERIVVVAPVPPKAEVKEISIQTDEWKPPPTQPSTPISSPGLYRVGSGANQQFQFIAPPAPSTVSTGQMSPVMPTGAGVSHIPVPPPGPLSNLLRESSGTFARVRSSASDKRQSMESVISSTAEELPSRPRVPSTGTMLTVVDKTRPPTMSLPPPPRLPPPPTTMAPPSFIPERRIPSGSTGSNDVPPPRPSSPPPAELIQRATTPTFGAALSVPSGKGTPNFRQHGSSMPPSQAGLRQPPSTSSFRSAANAAAYAQHSTPLPGVLSSFSVREKERREFSQTSLISERSVASPRSSMSSEHNLYRSPEPVTPNKAADTTPRGPVAGMTDPAIIHAITQTMIGEFLYKYTRRTIGKGHGERRHKRFFWVHPYTKTLYWSSADPGSSNVSESSAKSAYIEGVRSVLDPNPMPPGLYQYSVVVSTPQREMKITAPTKERHDIWLNALKYLLSRPNGTNVTSPGNATVIPQSPASQEFTDEDRRLHLGSSPQSQRTGRSVGNTEGWNITPRGQRSRSQVSVKGSIGKRSNTPAMEYLRWNGPDSPYSPSKSFVDVPHHDEEDLDFELHGESMSDDGYEGLENVRACCDGRHTVGRSGKIIHHHHHHNGDHQHLEPAPREPTHARPSSPAWSFRSRTGSAHSNDVGGTGIFSWGRGEDGKLRFGSRRSAKTTPNHDQ